ncbi:hypothetical protein F4604DRAFT_1745980 [Suillus subluteus]|nr:hypothetical protein F4604DRAFT_1745980 [Suillus subluteus]
MTLSCFAPVWLSGFFLFFFQSYSTTNRISFSSFLYQFSLVMFQTGKRRLNIQYHTDFHYIRLLVTAHFSYILYSRVQGLDGEGPSILVLHHLP